MIETQARHIANINTALVTLVAHHQLAPPLLTLSGRRSGRYTRRRQGPVPLLSDNGLRDCGLIHVDRGPNHPECANFASKLCHVLFGATSTQIFYVCTLCVDIALIITFANFVFFLSFALTHAFFLCKKYNKIFFAYKKTKKNAQARLKPGAFCLRSYCLLHSANLTFLLNRESLLVINKTCKIWRMRTKCAKNAKIQCMC